MRDIISIKSFFPLQGEQVHLHLFKREDITESYVGWLNDKDVVRYSNQRFINHSIASSVDYFNSFQKNNALFVAIRLKDTGQMVGTMTVYFNYQHQVADIGIMIGEKNCWGKGIGKDAWLTLLTFLSNEVGVRKITGGTLALNLGMIKIMRETGMKEDGVRREHELVDGKAHDILHFTKLSHE
ncbi:MAG: GNAT family protein [Legionella sp.]|nr:GNAT family protein [Legionella sp.]